jgi:hypothetical protein
LDPFVDDKGFEGKAWRSCQGQKKLGHGVAF